MKEGWQIKKFDEVLEIRNGKNQRDVESASGEFPIYGSAGNVMGMATSYICEAGTTIIGRKGNINSPIYTKTRFWNVDTAFGLAAKSGLDSKYLFFFCLYHDFSVYNRGTTIPSLVKSELLQIPIPIPSLSEQKRIVAVLDKAFAALAKAKENAEKNLANARELFDSNLQAIFTNPGIGWENGKIGEIADIEYGFTDNAKSAGPYRYIRITDIDRNGGLEKENKVFVGSSEDTKRFLLQEGDLLMARTGATFGKVLLYEDLEKSIFASYLIRIVFKIDFANKLYWYFSKSKTYWDQANKLASGSAQPQFNGNALKEIVLSFPKSLKEQKKTVAKLDGLYSESIILESVYQRKIKALGELKKSILQKAFTGELVGANS